MPKTAATTKTQLENATENAKVKAQRKIVHCTLIFDEIEFSPVALYEALDTKYGTVASETDSANRGTYIFKISA